MDIAPDFSTYSHAELLEAASRLDKDKYPERYAEIQLLLNDQEHLASEKENYRVDIEMNKYSTFWPRFWAAIIDGFVFMAVIYFECRFFGIEYSIHDRFLQAVNGVQIGIYYIVMHGLCGQTIGKMIMNIKVVRHDTETDINMSHALRRESVNFALCVISVFILLLIAITIEPTGLVPSAVLYIAAGFSFLSIAWTLSEFVTMLFNDKRRAIHDFMGRTVVIRI